MFTFSSDYCQMTGMSHVWAAKITGDTNHVCSPLGTDTTAAIHTWGLGSNINIKALFARKSAGFKQLQKYHSSY